MEGHRCKLCLKSFMNGRALGGHMRSHIFNNLPLVAAKPAGSSEEEGTTTSYELRENPRTNIRLADQGFSFLLQDRESETESSKNPNPNPIQRRRGRRRRRKRRRNYYPIIKPVDEDENKQARSMMMSYNSTNNQPSSKTTESWTDQAASSISNATTEEDVAFCLMLLSKDTWIIDKEEETPSSSEEDEEVELKQQQQSKNQRGKCNYKCETCNKVFKSYQALGGHRASHKKIRLDDPPKLHPVDAASNKKIHQCPVCYRVFSSGQALGGHKRSHVMMATKLGHGSSTSFIDLNLPAPPEDFAVSDPEFARR